MSDVVSEVQQSCVFMLQHAKRLHKLYFHENKKQSQRTLNPEFQKITN